MATVDDRWHRTTDGRKTRTDRYGKGRRWSVRWVDEQGAAHRRAYETQDAAKAAAAALEVAIGDGTYVDPRRGRATVAEYARRWLASRIVEPNTTRWYSAIVGGRIQDRWGAVPIATVTQAQVQEWLGELRAGGLSASRVRAHHVVLSGALQHAVNDRAITANAAAAGTRSRAGVQLPKLPKKRPNYLDPVQVALAIRALETGARAVPVDTGGDAKAERREEVSQRRRAVNGERKACFALTLVFSGLRFGEAAGLRVADLKGCRLTIDRAIATVGGRQVIGDTKSHRHRDVVLPKEVAARLHALAEGRPDDAPLLPAARGGRWHYGVWRDAWVLACDLATTHGLRHTAVSLAVRSGADIKVVQRMVGHASAVLTLDTYAELYEDQLAEVAKRMSQFVPAPLRLVEGEQRTTDPQSGAETGPGAVAPRVPRRPRKAPAKRRSSRSGPGAASGG